MGVFWKYLLCLPLISFLLIKTSTAQSVTDSVYRNNLLPSPTLSYSPETDVVVGLFGLYQFKFKGSDTKTRASNIVLYASSSFNDQVAVGFENNILIPTLDAYFFKGLIEFKRWPELYFGIGPGTKDEDAVIAEYNIFTADQNAYRNIGKNFFLGFLVKYFNYYNLQFLDTEGSVIVPPSELEGQDGGSYFGPGFGILKDGRNSITTPYKSYYLELSTHFYSTALGSTSDYTSVLLDARKYIDFSKRGKHVLALQGKALFKSGETPFTDLAKLGGKYIMRGYLEGRYRDNNYFQMQAEFRAQVYKRFGVTLFAGTGTVMPYLGYLAINKFKATVGFGLRYNINLKDPANIRIDFGYGFEKEAKGVYITFGEAF